MNLQSRGFGTLQPGKFPRIHRARFIRSLRLVDRLTPGQSLQFRQIALDEGEFFGSGPALDLAFAPDGRRPIRMRLGEDKLHWRPSIAVVRLPVPA